MKLTLVLTMVFNLQVLAITGYSQTKVTLDLKSVDFRQVISAIEHKTSYRFVFSERKMPNTKGITINANDQDALLVLEQALTGTSFTYRKLGHNRIAIVPESSAAADIRVTGKVLDEKGEPLIGATVKVKGNLKGGASTDANGSFTLNVPENAVLTIAYLGYDPQEVPVNGRTSLTISMSPSSRNLEEVVVVGYGTQRKADVTGAIASVPAAAIARAATPDATGALQGQMPGVVVVKNVGKPGSGYNINIRGISSIGNFSNSPLFVIDGIPSTSGLNELNPADIEKIDVLKDASATAIYGSRGAKGVVIVTTKRGKAGKTVISYDAYAGMRTPHNLPEMLNGMEYVDFRREMFRAQGRDTSRSNAAFFTPAQWQNIDAGKFTDWPELVLKNGLQMNHNVTASGGDEKTRFAFGAGLLQEDGNVSPESFKRYSIRGNIDRQISDKWKAGLNLYLSQNLRDLGSSEALRSAYRLPPMAYPYDDAGNKVFAVYGTNAVTNPLFDMENDIRQNRNLRTFGNLYVQVEPIKGLTLKSTISPNFSTDRFGSYFGPLTKERLGGALPPSGSTSTTERFTWLLDNQVTFEKQSGDHKLTATVVQSLQKDRLESSNITVEGLPYKSLWYNLATAGTVRAYGSGFTKSTLASLMGRVNYVLKDKYLITATGRWDGSSRLAEGNQWGFFPSASLAWRISQEDFLRSSSLVNDLKVRLSYGVTGNDRVDPYSTQASLGQSFYDFGGTLAPGYAPNQLPNKNLTWETTKEVNLGLDYAFLNNRVYGSVDVYNRVIDNILMSRLLPPQTGFASITDNIGKLRNKGIEVGLSTINVQKGKFMWKTDFVFDANKNIILELNGGKRDDVGNSLFIGQPAQVNYNYVFDGIWQLDEATEAAKFNQKPGQIRVRDLDANGVINGSDRQIIGKRIPNWTGSFSNTFRYGNVDLYIMIYTRRGEQFQSSFDATFMSYNQDYNQVKVDYWTPANPSQTYFQPGNPGPYTVIPTFRKVDFTRIGNITLGYNLPADLFKKIGVSNLRVYATATNPFTFTDYEGFDPEWPSTNTFGTAVSSSSYLFGLNLSF